MRAVNPELRAIRVVNPEPLLQQASELVKQPATSETFHVVHHAVDLSAELVLELLRQIF